MCINSVPLFGQNDGSKKFIFEGSKGDAIGCTEWKAGYIRMKFCRLLVTEWIRIEPSFRRSRKSTRHWSQCS